jgi:D-alanyl-D-alanine dipeptidase
MRINFRRFRTMIAITAVLSLLISAASGLSLQSYASTSIKESLIDLSKLKSDFAFDLKYATANNFTGRKMYASSICCLQEGTAWKLVKANEELIKKGYRIKIWDAYRPYSVQKAMWKIMPNSHFLANPYNGGSKHNKGASVDITLVDANGKELEMPSSFDEFSIKASRNNPDMTKNARKNLKILTDAMVKSGFKSISNEWWHFDDTESAKYSILDVKPDAVAKRILPVESLKCIGDSNQVILVSNNSTKSSKAVLQAFERTNGKWQKIYPDISANIGKNGFKKVKNSVLTKDEKAVYKHEGDGCSPMGAFTITSLFGWGNNPFFNLKYKMISVNDYWVSGNTKGTYNILLSRIGGPDKSWTIFEKLKIPQYKFAALINYNTGSDKIIGNGSAIFLHIADKKGYTSGCTSVAEADLIKILKWLKADKKPIIVQGTQAELKTIM